MLSVSGEGELRYERNWRLSILGVGEWDIRLKHGFFENLGLTIESDSVGVTTKTANHLKTSETTRNHPKAPKFLATNHN